MAMLQSEKLAAGPLMSFSGATRRLFRMGPMWLRFTIMPWVWLIWIFTVCPFYYLGGWIFFPHVKLRQQKIEEARHRELMESQRRG